MYIKILSTMICCKDHTFLGFCVSWLVHLQIGCSLHLGGLCVHLLDHLDLLAADDDKGDNCNSSNNSGSASNSGNHETRVGTGVGACDISLWRILKGRGRENAQEKKLVRWKELNRTLTWISKEVEMLKCQEREVWSVVKEVLRVDGPGCWCSPPRLSKQTWWCIF